MSVSLEIKICGLSTPETVEAAIAAGADMLGFVFFPKSPRNVPVERAAALAALARGRAKLVALVVDASDALLGEIAREIRPDWLQLHGHETPERVAAIRRDFGVPVMKAIGIAEAADLAGLPALAAVADRLLLDAKPPKGAELPGGNGLPFDWRLVASLDPGRPFMLSGGLTPDNVGTAVRLVGGARGFVGLDVSSGVESAPGVKDAGTIRAFVEAARTARRPPENEREARA